MLLQKNYKRKALKNLIKLMKNRSKVSMIENVKINKSMSDFDATKIKVIFMDNGGVLLTNG